MSIVNFHSATSGSICFATPRKKHISGSGLLVGRAPELGHHTDVCICVISAYHSVPAPRPRSAFRSFFRLPLTAPSAHPTSRLAALRFRSADTPSMESFKRKSNHYDFYRATSSVTWPLDSQCAVSYRQSI